MVKRLAAAAIPTIVVLILVTWGCRNAAFFGSAAAPRIDDAHRVLYFQVEDNADVEFEHARHSEEWYDGSCLECHSHANVRDDSIWGCGACHGDEDPEQLCESDAEGHDCMYAQCALCHATLPEDPTPDCDDCHMAAVGPQDPFPNEPPPAFDLNTSVTYYSKIDSAADVDVFEFNLTAVSSTVAFDIESWEGHMTGVDFFNNGVLDHLVTNIHLYDDSDTLLGSAACPAGTTCWVGTTHPNVGNHKFGGRSHKNAYLEVTGLAAGTYRLMVGASALSASDALTGINSDGVGWSGPNPQNFRVTFTRW